MRPALTYVVPAVDVLGPDLEVKLWPARQATAGVVDVQGVRPHYQLAIWGGVYMCLPLVEPLQ